MLGVEVLSKHFKSRSKSTSNVNSKELIRSLRFVTIKNYAVMWDKKWKIKWNAAHFGISPKEGAKYTGDLAVESNAFVLTQSRL